MPITPSSTAVRRPTVDEWGVYDPQQAGLAALFTRLMPKPAPQADPGRTEPTAQPLQVRLSDDR